MVEIRQQKLGRFTGNFDRYLQRREAADAQLLTPACRPRGLGRGR